MPYQVKVVVKNRRGLVDSRAFVEVQAKAAADYLSQSLVDGIRPEDGEPRPRKGDGKPLGFDTGLLARSIAKPKRVYTTRKRSQVMIRGASSRAHFVQKQGDVLTLAGIVKDKMDQALREHMENR
jgi:hypothetical protein